MKDILARGDKVLLICLLLFALFFRLATLMMIHTGVDERDYWLSAKAITHGLPYPELSHRTTRFAVILPVASAQIVLGTHPDVYYVLPLVNSLLQTALAFLIGLRLRGRLTGFLAGLALVLFPYMIRAGSQVRPEIFSVTYVLLAFYFFIEYMQRDTREIAPLLWTGAILFVAYEAKITNLFFLPGLLFGIFIYKKKPLHALLLCAVIVLLFLLETAAYAVFTDYKFGVFQIILARHIQEGEPFVVARFVDLLGRYSRAHLQVYWQIPFALFAVGAAIYLIKGADKRLCALLLAALSFFAGITFEIAGLRPIMPAEPFINRYFSAVLGPVFLLLAYAAEGIAASVLHHRQSAASPRSQRPYLALLGLGVLAVIGLFSLPHLPAGIRAYANSPLHLRQHPLVLNEVYRRGINAAYREGIPIVAADGNGGENAIQTCESYFIDLSHYQDGRPPRHARVSLAGASYLVLSRDNTFGAAGRILAAVRAPFRVVPMPAGRIRLLTDDSVDGKKGPADEDDNQ